MIILVSRPDSSEPERLELDKTEIVIGKRAECDVVLADPKVSRRHARIIARDRVLFVEDLGSTNGTWLGGRRLERREAIQADDALEIGNFTVRARLVDEPERPRVLVDPDRTVLLPAGPAAAAAEVPSVPPPTLASRPTSASPEHERAGRTVKGVRAELELTSAVGQALGERREEEFVLICLSGPQRGLRYRISSDEVLIGSRSGCGIVVVGVEPVHAKLERRSDQWELHNLGSAASVVHRGRRPRDTVLATPDVVKIGEVVFRFVRAGEVFPPGFSESELERPLSDWRFSIRALRNRRAWLAVATAVLLVLAIFASGLLFGIF